jgi:hypothetical protein
MGDTKDTGTYPQVSTKVKMGRKKRDRQTYGPAWAITMASFLPSDWRWKQAGAFGFGY